MTIALLIVGVIALLGALFVARTFWAHYRWVMHDFDPWPSSEILAHPERTNIPRLTAVSFTSRNGDTLAGWYVPARNRAAVVVTHGTNADRSSMLDEIRMLAAAGFGVLAFDWPGDGLSSGEIHWQHGERDALTAAIDWLTHRTEVDADRIGAFGFSMGGYVTTQVAAADRRLGAVVIASAPESFVGYVRTMHRKFGWLSGLAAEAALRQSGMSDESHAPIDVIAQIAPRPVLLIGGSEDRTIPLAMTRHLFSKAREPKQLLVVAGAGHGHYAQAQPDEYRRDIVDFFTANLLQKAPSP